MTPRSMSLTVNGRVASVSVSPTVRLVSVLRDELGLTGTKEGCGGGECGSCTVLIDGVPRLACLVLAADVAGRRVTTIEASNQERIERLRAAFLEHDGYQCGFCTPGMIMAASALPIGATAEQVREALAGNICRCTGYQRIVQAVVAALAGPA